jgi:hypothetical protein
MLPSGSNRKERERQINKVQTPSNPDGLLCLKYVASRGILPELHAQELFGEKVCHYSKSLRYFYII